jgi:class 3 adenylate cyclase/tetratricopeptide (TPR) repeat protein
MSQIAQWLDGLGMSEYAARFAENRIDFLVLRELTDQDLKDLDIVLGDRRKLLRAIRELDTRSATSESAERRQLTLMFCDLVGSTTLSANLDPEDLRAVIGAYHRCCAETVERLGGFVAKYMGDGVLVYFGYPQAHEHDAERAVEAGVALVEEVPKLVTPAGAPLQVRVGIATGMVVVGDLVGSGESQERGVVGETPNLAARLQGVAEPNSVVIGAGTRRLLGDLFELQGLGAQELKGIPGPVPAWAVLRARKIENRFEALHAGAGMTPLAGRASEAEELVRCWSRARAGEGQAVLLSGEAGVGKSRLVADLIERVGAEQYQRLRYFCSPQQTASAFHPIVGQLERAMGFAPTDSVAARLDKLDTLLAGSSPADGMALADLLGIANDGRYPVLALTPAQSRQRTLDTLIAQVEARARRQPTLMIFEDVHWADPSSLEWLGRMIERMSGLGLMLIVTFRPEFAPPWLDMQGVTTVSLGRLSESDAMAMIDRLVGGGDVLPKVRRDIVERADGIPLFVQEMTKAVLEGDGGAVPATLQASLLSRLDRLGEAKETAQLAAAIGREFSHDLLACVTVMPARELGRSLDRLVMAGLLFRQQPPPHATYLFNHALVQDAAYGTLLREARRAIHARIVYALETRFPDVAESQPELVARHCTEAGLVEKAASLWGKAGRRSFARSALWEAAEQLSQALGQIASLPGSPELRRDQIRLQLDLSNALIHTKGHAAPETKAAFDRARSLIEQAAALGEAPEDPLIAYSVLYGFWVANRMAFNGPAALELAAQFQALAQAESARVPLMLGHMLAGISLVVTGRLSEGKSELDQAIALYDPAEDRMLATRFGHDVRVSASAWRAFASWALGDAQASLADRQSAVAGAREIGHAASLMFALSHVALTLLHADRRAEAKGLIDELVALAESKGTLYWKSYGLLLRGWLAALEGDAAQAVATIELAMAEMRSTGATGYAPWYLSILARAQATLGRRDEARRSIAEALSTMEVTGEKWCERDVLRRASEIATQAYG